MFPGNSTANFSPKPGITSASSPARRRVFFFFFQLRKKFAFMLFFQLEKNMTLFPHPCPAQPCAKTEPLFKKSSILIKDAVQLLWKVNLFTAPYGEHPPLLDFNKKSLNLTSKSLKNPVSGDIFIARYHIINYRKISCRIVKTPSMNI